MTGKRLTKAYQQEGSLTVGSGRYCTGELTRRSEFALIRGSDRAGVETLASGR